MPTLLKNLRRILLLFDSILIEEYSPEAPHMRKLTEDEYIDHLACDFCGGDVFQSFFECCSCVDGRKPANHGAGLIICPGCYVEGRTCHCEKMIPVQSRPLGKLFDARQRAVDLYNGLKLDYRITDTVPSKELVFPQNRQPTFTCFQGVTIRRSGGTLSSGAVPSEEKKTQCKKGRSVVFFISNSAQCAHIDEQL